MEKYFVFGFGHALIDIEYAVSVPMLEQLSLEKGHRIDLSDAQLVQLQQTLTQVPEKIACGGSAANTLVTITMLGTQSFFYGKVNDDQWGHDYLTQLRQQHVDTSKSFLTKNPQKTGCCIVFVTPDGDRTMCTHLGAASDIQFEDISNKTLENCDYFFIESYALNHQQTFETAINLKEFAKTHHKKIALSLSDPDLVLEFHDRLSTLLSDGKIDLLFANEQEALNFAKTTVLSDALEHLKTKSKHFAITRGGNGAVIFDGKQTLEVPAIKTSIIDLLGAGDAFAGGMLFALSKNLSLLDATKFAHQVASKVVSQFGPRLNKQQAIELAKLI